jgi:hypothetical protein
MIVCRECGNAAESVDGFCASCGVLLEWSGQPVEAAAGAVDGRRPPARKPVAERDRPGPTPLVAGPAQAGPYCSACGVRNPEDRTFCRSCGEPLRAGSVASGSAPGWWRRLLARLSGRRSYAAGDRPRGFLSHDAVPGRAAGATAGATAASRPGTPAGGGRLGPSASGARPAPLPGRPMPAAPAAGHRLGTSAAGSHSPGVFAGSTGPRIRRVKPPRRLALSRFAPFLLVLGLLGVGLGPGRTWITTHVFGLAHRAQTQLNQRYANVVPVSATASSAAPGHPAKLAIDGIEQTYWLTGGGAGTGTTITVRFASPQRIDRIGMLSGEPGGDYRAQARPQTIELFAGGSHPVTVPFDDTLSFQNRPVSLHDVTAITVVIKNVYPGQQGQAVALRELEFFAKV